MSLRLSVYNKSIDQQTFTNIYTTWMSHSTTVTLSTSAGSAYPTTHYNVSWRIFYYSHNGEGADPYFFNYKYHQTSVTVEETEQSYTADKQGKMFTDWFFEAIVEEVRIFIKYDLNGGTNRIGGSEENIYYRHGNSFTLPTNITKTGYTLSGFEGPFSGIGQPGTVKLINVRGDRNIKANWTINRYLLTYEANNGTLRGDDYTSGGNYIHGTNIILPTSREKTGYRFNNFSVTGSTYTSLSTSFTLTGHTTVTANWTITQYTVTYLSTTTPNHFDFTPPSASFDYGTLLTNTVITFPITTPRVIGEVYSFEKWTYGGSDLGDSRLPPENINLEANWTSTDNDEIQMSELSSVFDPSSSFQNIKISNYFNRLKLDDSSQRENVDFFNKLKGRGTF